jgi:5-methylthioadenosine/S-adenosylhomocysteine deaminase
LTHSILLKNAALMVTVEPTLGEGPLGTLEEADLLFAGDRIAAVGKGLSAPGALRIDATGKIVLPGFVDVHNHLWQSVIRGCGAQQSLLGWLDSCVFSMGFPGGAIMSPSDVHTAVTLSALDVISTGITTVVDWAHLQDLETSRAYVRALEDSGLRFVFAVSQLEDQADVLRRIKAELIDGNSRAAMQVSSHPTRDYAGHLKVMARLAGELGVKLNVHLLENSAQREQGAWEALEHSGALELGPGLLVNHAVHLKDEEIVALAERDVRVSHNPLSNMRLASGIIRLPELHEAGVKLGLGLDGASNDTSDMFATMRAAVGLQRVRSLRVDTFPSITDVIRAATMGGAEVLDMAGQIGSLAPGKKADVIILDPAAINFAPRHDWLAQIVFNAQPANVETVFVEGRPLKMAGRLVGMNPAAAVAAAEQVAARVREALRKAGW